MKKIGNSREPAVALLSPAKRLLWATAGMAALLTGCQGVPPVPPPVIGLRPIYPPLRYQTNTHWGIVNVLSVEVDSLQPTLRWEAFPQSADREADKEGLLNRIQNVRYDLRIWRAGATIKGQKSPSRRNTGGKSAPPPLAGDRVPFVALEGLPGPEYALEQPLQPCTAYYWTVRARFDVDGQIRVNEWGLAEWPQLSRDPKVRSNTMPRRIYPMPTRCYFSFKTTAEAGKAGE